MIRTEINVETGDITEIKRIAYKNSSNELLILDDGEEAPDGYSQITDAEAIALNAPSTAEIIAALEAEVQIYIDSKAKEKGYDSASRCISYINSTNTTWKAEASAMNAWRDAVWLYCAGLVSSATAAPTKEELIAELPAAPW